MRPVCEYCQKTIWRQNDIMRRHYLRQNLDACTACATQYLGRYDLENPALVGVLKCREKGRRLRWKAARTWDEKQAAARLQVAYATRVRSLSRAHLQRLPDVLNPNGHRIGKSGNIGSYQLDHIVPVIMCWEHYVPPEDAAAVRNLQVVPWSMNVARWSNLYIEDMVGYVAPASAQPAILPSDAAPPSPELAGSLVDPAEHSAGAAAPTGDAAKRI